MDRWLVWMALGAAACGPSLGDGDDGAPSSTDDTTGAANTSGVSASDGAVGTTADDDEDATSADGSTDAADSTETGEIPTALCNPAELHGPFLELHAESDWAAFEGCEDDTVYLERPGIEPIDTVEGFDNVPDFEAALLAIPGVTGVGRGLCCDGSTVCIGVNINRWSYSLPVVFDTVHETFGELGDVCFGIRLNLTGAEGPRCEADDPECLPLPVCEGIKDSACCQAPPLDLEAPRIPVGDDLSTGTCTHDGDCLIFHTVCGDYMTPSGAGFNQCTDEIANAFCGCVDDACHWYEQG